MNISHRIFFLSVFCMMVLGVLPDPAAAASSNAMSSPLTTLWQSTGIYGFMAAGGLGKFFMILVSLLLIYLAIVKDFEPLLLLPIGFGGLLCNIPLAGIAEVGGFLNVIYNMGITTGLFPLLIFMSVGAMTDFGPLIANPKTALLGAAAQLGIFGALLGARVLSTLIPGIDFTLQEAASIGIIGGADGPTSIFLTSRLAPDLLGSIAVAAYSYMALVPIIQPPIMRLLTNDEERKIVMKQMRPVSKTEKIVFALMVLLLCALLLPTAAPLMGALMFGNLCRECGVVNRLSDTMQNSLCNIVTILLGLAVGTHHRHSVPRTFRLCPQYCRRRSPRQTDEQSLQRPHQSTHRSSRRFRRSHGSACGPQAGQPVQPPKLSHDARHGAQCFRRNRLHLRRRLPAGDARRINAPESIPSTPSTVPSLFYKRRTYGLGKTDKRAGIPTQLRSESGRS